MRCRTCGMKECCGAELYAQESELTKLRKRVEVLEKGLKSICEHHGYKILDISKTKAAEGFRNQLYAAREALSESAKIAEGEG